MPVLRFLGTSDSQGVPRWWCSCHVCAEARTTGKNARTRPSVLLESEGQKILIDAAPEFRLQITKEMIDSIDALIITHAHNDHILGLGDVADFARWTKKATPVYAPLEVIVQVQERFSYLTKGSYPTLTPFESLESAQMFAGYQVTAHKVPHGFNGVSYGLHFANESTRWAYIPDSIHLQDLTPWHSLDLLILGTSFYKEEARLENRSVYDVQEALKLIAELQPKQTIFTHLGHGVDSRKTAPQKTRYASDGLVIVLP
jgi:phosphoribosyl 1,2-cyclic phosphate phosphodiesterase